jgi:hypothetical protein
MASPKPPELDSEDVMRWIDDLESLTILYLVPILRANPDISDKKLRVESFEFWLVKVQELCKQFTSLDQSRKAINQLARSELFSRSRSILEDARSLAEDTFYDPSE